MKNRIAAAALAACLTLSMAACGSSSTTADPSAGSSSGTSSALPQRIKDAGTIVIGMSPDFPPMEYKDADQLVGADIDIAKALGQQWGVEVKFEEMAFDQLVSSVQTARVDLVMSGMSDTVERQKTVDFVDYFKSQGRLYTTGARAAEFTKATDACGKTLAVSRKTDFFTHVQDLSASVCTAAGLPEITVLPTDSGSAARLQLDQGRADLAAQGAENLAYFEKTQPGTYAVVLDPLPSDPFGILVQKDDTELANAVLDGVEALQASGTYDTILDQWDLSYAKMTPAINGVS